MDLRRAVGENVKRLREAAGLTQEDVAHAANVHPTYLSGVERGRRNPTVLVVQRLAEALKVHPRDVGRSRG
jgi:transcriptional regulator with XRE-family HTH domain